MKIERYTFALVSDVEEPGFFNAELKIHQQ